MKKKNRKGFFHYISPLTPAKDLYSSTKKQQINNYSFFKEGISRLVKNTKTLLKKNNPNAEHAPSLDDFDSVLKHWGISRDQLKTIKRGMVIEMISYAALIILLCFGLTTTYNLYIYIQLCVVILAVCFLCLMRFWKFWMLKHEKFVFFKDFLTLNY